MNPNVTEIGGGSATDFASQFSNAMKGVLGGPGAAGAQTGLSGFLNDLFSQGAGNIGGALKTMIGTQQTNDVNALRARYGASGGGAFGTPAAYAESQYRAQAAPAATSAIGNLQLSAMAPLMAAFTDIFNKGTSQRQTMVGPSDAAQAFQIGSSVIGKVIGAFSGGAPSGGGGASGDFSSIGLPKSLNYTQGTASDNGMTDWQGLIKSFQTN